MAGTKQPWQNNSAPLWAALRVLLVAWALGACAAALPKDVERPVSHAFANPEASEIGRLVAPATAAHAGKSGLLLLDLSEESLLWRGALIGAAQHSIDAQYYIWDQDNIGILAAAQLLQAAERGVRVRVLVDDFPSESGARQLALLHAHRNVEVRVYNPFPSRTSATFWRAMDFLGDYKRLNRRMHNKVMLVDGSVAVVGGRNVADPYYDMHDAFTFRDRDVSAVAAIVPDVAASFDAFWNSTWSYPVDVAAESEDGASDEQRREFYQWLLAYPRDPAHVPQRYREMLVQKSGDLAKLPTQLIWAETEVLYDRPGKNDDLERMDAFGRSGKRLTELALATRQELLAETPYLIFVPGTFAVVEELRSRGVKIRVLTNSLASTDAVLPFNAYARQRRRMLDLGIELFELRPDATSRSTLIKRFKYLDPDARLTLHAKTAVFDREHVYIGTFNMDPRSTHLNTEIGLLIRSRELAEQVSAALAQDMRPENAWRLSLDDEGEIRWYDAENETFVRHAGEPKTGFWRSLESFLLSFVSFESVI